MVIEVIGQAFSICQISHAAEARLDDAYCFLSKTCDEISLVCLTESVPAGALARDDGWRAMMIKGTLDFSMVGILAGISSLLAEARVSIFALSTYNTDYILTRESDLDQAIDVLSRNGYNMT